LVNLAQKGTDPTLLDRRQVDDDGNLSKHCLFYRIDDNTYWVTMRKNASSFQGHVAHAYGWSRFSWPKKGARVIWFMRDPWERTCSAWRFFKVDRRWKKYPHIFPDGMESFDDVLTSLPDLIYDTHFKPQLPQLRGIEPTDIYRLEEMDYVFPRVTGYIMPGVGQHANASDRSELLPAEFTVSSEAYDQWYTIYEEDMLFYHQIKKYGEKK
jgi:hypothetical protein